MADEFGHSRDWEQHRTAPFVAAVDRMNAFYRGETQDPPSEGERRTILDEEKRAWDRGRDVLTEAGFTDWEMFDANEREPMRT